MDISIIFKIAAIGIIITVVCQILKKSDRDDIAMYVSIIGVILVLTVVVGMIGDLFGEIKEIFELDRRLNGMSDSQDFTGLGCQIFVHTLKYFRIDFRVSIFGIFLPDENSPVHQIIEYAVTLKRPHGCCTPIGNTNAFCIIRLNAPRPIFASGGGKVGKNVFPAMVGINLFQIPVDIPVPMKNDRF